VNLQGAHDEARLYICGGHQQLVDEVDLPVLALSALRPRYGLEGSAEELPKLPCHATLNASQHCQAIRHNKHTVH